MNQQERIDKIIRASLMSAYMAGKLNEPYHTNRSLEELKLNLDSQGVVVKIDGELPQALKRPTRLMGATYPEEDIWKGDEHFEPCPLCGQAGYTLTKRLI